MVKKHNWNVLGRGDVHSEYKHVEGERKEVRIVITRQPYSLQWNLILYLLLRLVSQRGRPASLKWMLNMGNGVWGNWSDMKWIQRRVWGEGSGVILRRFRQKHLSSAAFGNSGIQNYMMLISQYIMTEFHFVFSSKTQVHTIERS